MVVSRWLAVFFVLLFFPNVALTHGVSSSIETQPAVSVTFHFDDHSPMSDQPFEIRAPGSDRPYQTGHTDPQGRVVFRPDRQGTWQVRTFTTDGHGAMVKVQVTPEMLVTAESHKRSSKSTKLITGGAIIFGIFGVAALIANRKG